MEVNPLIGDSHPAQEKSQAVDTENISSFEKVTGIQKLGCSLAVIIPAKVAANMGLVKGTRVKVSASGKDKIVVEKSEQARAAVSPPVQQQ